MFSFFHTPEISASELQQWKREKRTFTLLDVREPEEHSFFNLGGTLIPLMELPSRLSELPTDQPVVVYCRSGSRSAIAVQLLRKAGIEAYNLQGGILDWKENEQASAA